MQEQNEEIQEKNNKNQSEQKEEDNPEEHPKFVDNKEPEICQNQDDNQNENNKIINTATPPKNVLDLLKDPTAFEVASLSSAKKLLKQIEEEQKILNNRVELLELEKFKMDRNIDLTNSKTSQILLMKGLHLKKIKTREVSEKEDQQFRIFLQEKIKQRKRDKNDLIKKSLQKHKQKQRDLIQQMKKENQNIIQQQKLWSLQKHKNQASLIKNFEEIKKKELNILRKNQINLVIKENQLEIQKISQLAAQHKLEMLEKEKQEQNLMLQLQKTQLVQKNALEQLENAFTLPINELEENEKNSLLNEQNRLIDLPSKAKLFKMRKSKTQNKIKLPPWNSCTVVEKLEKSSLASYMKYRQKMHSQLNYKGLFNDNNS